MCAQRPRGRAEAAWACRGRVGSLSNIKTNRFKASGAWKTIIDKSGKEYKFQSKDWLNKLKNKDFKDAVVSILEEEFIEKYKK